VSSGINNVNNVQTGESMRAITSPDDGSERSEIPPTGEVGRSAVSPAGESEGATASSDDASEMIIRGGDGGTTSRSGEDSGFTTGDCGSAGSGSTCTGVGSSGAASLGLTMEFELQARLLAQENAP